MMAYALMSVLNPIGYNFGLSECNRVKIMMVSSAFRES